MIKDPAIKDYTIEMGFSDEESTLEGVGVYEGDELTETLGEEKTPEHPTIDSVANEVLMIGFRGGLKRAQEEINNLVMTADPDVADKDVMERLVSTIDQSMEDAMEELEAAKSLIQELLEQEDN